MVSCSSQMCPSYLCVFISDPGIWTPGSSGYGAEFSPQTWVKNQPPRAWWTHTQYSNRDKMEGTNWLLKVVLWSPGMCHSVHRQRHTERDTHTPSIALPSGFGLFYYYYNPPFHCFHENDMILFLWDYKAIVFFTTRPSLFLWGCDKKPWPIETQGARVYLHLQVIIHQEKPGGRSWSKDHRGMLLSGLLPKLAQPFFFYTSGPPA